MNITQVRAEIPNTDYVLIVSKYSQKSLDDEEDNRRREKRREERRGEKERRRERERERERETGRGKKKKLECVRRTSSR